MVFVPFYLRELPVSLAWQKSNISQSIRLRPIHKVKLMQKVTHHCLFVSDEKFLEPLQCFKSLQPNLFDHKKQLLSFYVLVIPYILQASLGQNGY